jgi:biopolymer transport protein ExbD/biopolymer transport protein TolR
MAMGVSFGGKKSAVQPTMNVTPLVDVVLVLLIIFMVVTPLLQKQFWLVLPKKDDTEKEPPPASDVDKPVVLSVDTAGVVRINKDEVQKAELGDRLRRVFAARQDNVLYFDASEDAPYGVTVEVMDIARRGGAKQIAILTQKPGG